MGNLSEGREKRRVTGEEERIGREIDVRFWKSFLSTLHLLFLYYGFFCFFCFFF
jgi:hypothetical protein